jgi:hypothetical protein
VVFSQQKVGIIVVDVQGDFTKWKKGSLAVNGTDKDVDSLVAEKGSKVCHSQPLSRDQLIGARHAPWAQFQPEWQHLNPGFGYAVLDIQIPDERRRCEYEWEVPKQGEHVFITFRVRRGCLVRT